MNTLLAIPEIAGLTTSSGLVRIPPQLDVPISPRVRQLIDTAEFRRLDQRIEERRDPGRPDRHRGSVRLCCSAASLSGSWGDSPRKATHEALSLGE